MIIFFKILTAFFLISFCCACQETFIPDVPDLEPEIVVEGYIEAGGQASPPYVILTKSLPFFTEISSEELEDIFIHDAAVRVKESNLEISLTEVCLNDLTIEQRVLVSDFFGINLNTFQINFCVYVDLSFQMFGEEGKQYELTINVDNQDFNNKSLSAITQIPSFVPFDSLEFVPPPGAPNDTLLQLRGYITDPGFEDNFYRYFTKVEEEPLLPGFPSVSDDRLFNGQTFQFPIARALDRETNYEEVDFNTLGLFLRGDSIQVKFTNIDKAHFDFWNTLEFNAANQGPFSTYTRVDGNVKGALGIWGGYHAGYYDLVVPE